MEDRQIAVVGLGYVGLPLAVAFAGKYNVTGFDINSKRIASLSEGNDETLEIEKEDLLSVLVKEKSGSKGLFITSDEIALASCNVYIITVPTPVNEYNTPDLRILLSASATVGKYLKKGDIVVYESTVYPGCTEERCAPVLEKNSGLVFNIDFFCGYSPERINPGDKEHTITKIRKITSGSTEKTAKEVDALYGSIIEAGTYSASSLRVAEAAKVIENAQRDINIAFVNELAKIFNHIGIDTGEVLKAAGTKWNFLNFKPGLVGGHCIGVDPYYLAQKAQEVGYHPEIILAGRRLNDGMGAYIADEMIKLMIRKKIPVSGSKVLVLGFTFKENCPDVRNTRVIDIIKRLQEFDIEVSIYDPWADPAEVLHGYGVTCQRDEIKGKKFDGVVAAVAHREFVSLDIPSLCKDTAVVYDIKNILPAGIADKKL